jgi:hypothetical protein
MTRSQLNRAVARATGDGREIISSRGFSLVDETAAIDDQDLDQIIADWDRIRDEEIQSLGRRWSLAATTVPKRRRRNKGTDRSTRIVG